MKKYNLLRTLALTGLCCASITGAMAMTKEDVAVPSGPAVRESLRPTGEWERSHSATGEWYRIYEGRFRDEKGHEWTAKAFLLSANPAKPREDDSPKVPNLEVPSFVNPPSFRGGRLSTAGYGVLGGNPVGGYEWAAIEVQGVTTYHGLGPDECTPSNSWSGGFVGWKDCPIHGG